MNKNKLKIKGIVNPDQAVDYIESLVESIRSGKLEIEHGTERADSRMGSGFGSRRPKRSLRVPREQRAGKKS